MKAKDISYEELSTSFRYEEGKLFRLIPEGVTSNKWKRFAGQWLEVDISKSNDCSGYIQVKLKRGRLRAHRVIYCLYYKTDIAPDMQIDHIDGNRINNNPQNLRLVTNRENQQNQKGHREGRLCGATWHKRDKKWQVKININGKQKFLGYYSTQEEARAAYRAACLLLGV